MIKADREKVVLLSVRPRACKCECFSAVDLYGCEKVAAQPRINLLKMATPPTSLSPPLTDRSSLLNNRYRLAWKTEAGPATEVTQSERCEGATAVCSRAAGARSLSSCLGKLSKRG